MRKGSRDVYHETTQVGRGAMRGVLFVKEFQQLFSILQQTWAPAPCA